MENTKSVKSARRKLVPVLVGLLVIVITAAAVLAFMDKGKSVEFKVLSEKEYPQEVAGDVIPEYRTLERALACKVDDKIYVIVTRGEKPASGYKVSIDKMKLETEEGKETLIVYAVFKDPAKNDSMSQVLTYPLEVAEVQLKKLPDDIELRVQYEE